MYEAKLGDRSLFPTLAARAYLNHAAVSPPSIAVQEAVRTLLADYARRGVDAFATWIEQRHRLRGKLARLVNARPEDLGFAQSTTRALSDVALCFPWRRGDRLLVFEGEFPANVTPWQRAAELFGLELRMLPVAPFASDADEALAAVERELREGVRLVAVSLVQFQTGLRMPVEALGRLCARHGAQLCVDGVQAVGAVPVDVAAMGIDYLACGAHKWLMGLEGAAFLYVRPERIAALRPVVAGWLSHEDGLGFLLRGPDLLRYDRPVRKRADFIESGNLSGASFAALEASVDLLLQL
ncbi:MAG: aminotransferase class V-fold PLP-dependent enzyme, partial [Myxococcales bacterium]